MNKVYERNTAVWALNRLREDALPRLIDDLRDKHEEGIPEDVCVEVKATHQKLLDFASTVPDKSLLHKSILPVLEKYSEQYIAWNNIDGDDDESREKRRAAIKELRKTRHGLATVVRKNLHVLDNELDISLIDSMYKALSDLVTAAPNFFNTLAGAVARYFDRRKGGPSE